MCKAPDKALNGDAVSLHLWEAMMQKSCLGCGLHAMDDMMTSMCACAAAQQRLQEGDVSGALARRQDMALSGAVVWGAVPVEPAVRTCHHGESSQGAHPLRSPRSLCKGPPSEMLCACALKEISSNCKCGPVIQNLHSRISMCCMSCNPCTRKVRSKQGQVSSEEFTFIKAQRKLGQGLRSSVRARYRRAMSILLYHCILAAKCKKGSSSLQTRSAAGPSCCNIQSQICAGVTRSKSAVSEAM